MGVEGIGGYTPEAEAGTPEQQQGSAIDQSAGNFVGVDKTAPDRAQKEKFVWWNVQDGDDDPTLQTGVEEKLQSRKAVELLHAWAAENRSEIDASTPEQQQKMFDVAKADASEKAAQWVISQRDVPFERPPFSE